jgi:DNA-binding NarL/FixJ family response regulator
VKRVTYNSHSFSILLKDCSKEEVISSIESILKGEVFICHRIVHHLSAKKNYEVLEEKKLTVTEREILKEIASGKSTKEIANERCLSIHTVITHRKNIFRKLEVNNLHEATKYALRAGIIDASDYYI